MSLCGLLLLLAGPWPCLGSRCQTQVFRGKNPAGALSRAHRGFLCLQTRHLLCLQTRHVLCMFMHFYAIIYTFPSRGAPFFPGKSRRRPLHNDTQEAQKHVFPPQNAPFLPGEHMFFAGKKPLRERCLGRTKVSCVCRQDICCVCRQDICCVSRQDICCVSRQDICVLPRHPLFIAHTGAAAKRPPLCSHA